MDSIHALLLAVVQGGTEFLPVSSSGHLVIVSALRDDIMQPLGFDIALHGATLAAVLVYFRNDLRRLFSRESRVYLLSLLVATLPVAIAGPLLYGHAETVFRSAETVAAALIISALFVLIADSIARRLPDTAPSPLRGVVVGLFQILALLPGVSRAGITMAAGRLVGFSRETAVRFSFLLSVPTIAGAVLFAAPDTASSAELHLLGIGLVVAFAVAYAVIHWFLKVVERVGFAPFCLYQIALGTLLLVV